MRTKTNGMTKNPCKSGSCFIRKKQGARRAGALKGLDELGLHEKTQTFLENSFLSADQVIKRGRELAYDFELKPASRNKKPGWQIQLASALYDTGFLRPASDFAYSFNLNRLYRDIFPNDDCFGYPCRVEQLTNEEYEDFKRPTDMEVQTVRSVLRKYLTEREFTTVYYHYGLADGRKWPFKEIGKMFDVGSSTINNDLRIALLKLQINIPSALS